MRRVVLALLLAGCSHKQRAAAPPAAIAIDAPAQYAAGKVALEANDLPAAEARFRAVVEAQPSPGEDPALRSNALLGLATLHKERGDKKGAVAYARRVVALRPGDMDALAVLVDLAHEAGELTTEIEAREAIVELDPDALAERLALAGALTVAKQDERAKAAFLGYEDARTRLVMALGKSPDPVVRRAAASALGAAHDGGTARALVLAMTDRDAGVRKEAVRAVGAVGVDLDPEVRPALKKMSSLERDPDVQAALREVLAQRAAPK